MASRPSLTLTTHSSTVKPSRPGDGRSYDRPMDVGLALPGDRPWEAVAGLASRAEGLGFTSLWLADPSEASAAAVDGALEPLTALAGLARSTTTAKLGVFLRGALRPPAVAAKAVATIDVLSGGRVVMALGEEPGATPDDLDALAEAVQVVRGAFGGGPFTFHGRHHRVEGLRCRPRPLQRPGPPIWVTGDDEHVLAVAAQHADGWGPAASTGTVEEYQPLSAALDGVCRKAGREPGDLLRFVRLEIDTPEEVGPRLAEWQASGVTTIILDGGALAFLVTSGDALEMVVSAVSSVR